MATRCILVLLTGCIFTFNSQAQSLASLTDTTLEWTGCLNYQKDTEKTKSPAKFRFINKDTVFKNDTFKVLIAYTDIDTFVMGGLREDTVNRKAYGFYSTDTAAYLMYDWNLKKGDTMSYPNIRYVVSDSQKIFINGKSSFKYIFKGIGSKNNTTFELTSPPWINFFLGQEHFWIPEMGSSVGILNPGINIYRDFEYKLPYNYLWHLSVSNVLKNTDTLFSSESCGYIFENISVPEYSTGNEPFMSVDYTSKTIHFSSAQEIKKVSVYDYTGREICGFLTDLTLQTGTKNQKIYSFDATNQNKFLLINIKFSDNSTNYKKLILN